MLIAITPKRTKLRIRKSENEQSTSYFLSLRILIRRIRKMVTDKLAVTRVFIPFFAEILR